MSVPEFNGYSMNLCYGIGSPTEVELPAVQPVRKAQCCESVASRYSWPA